MQSAKGEGLAGAFGGGALSGAVFGGRGAATFLSKATTVLAIVFMITSIGLSLLSANRGTQTGIDTGSSVVTEQMQQDMATQQQQQQQQPPPEGQPAEGSQEAVNPEDIFNTPPDTGGN
jgi:preprotein translocase subunit SecG